MNTIGKKALRGYQAVLVLIASIIFGPFILLGVGLYWLADRIGFIPEEYRIKE